MKACRGWISILLLIILSASSIFVAYYLNQVISQQNFGGIPLEIRKFDFESLGLTTPRGGDTGVGQPPLSLASPRSSIPAVPPPLPPGAAVLPTPTPITTLPPNVSPPGILFAMAHPPRDKICDYKAVLLDGYSAIFGNGDMGRWR